MFGNLFSGLLPNIKIKNKTQKIVNIKEIPFVKINYS